MFLFGLCVSVILTERFLECFGGSRNVIGENLSPFLGLWYKGGAGCSLRKEVLETIGR
jgi:hypothetical protein